VHLHPRAVKKCFRRYLQEKCVSAPPGHEVLHPEPEQESISGHFLQGGLHLEVYLDRILRATTKKRSSTFLTKKCTPDKILAPPMYMA